MHRDGSEERAPCVDARRRIDNAFADPREQIDDAYERAPIDDAFDEETDEPPGELTPPPLLRAGTEADPHAPDADDDVETVEQVYPPREDGSPAPRRTVPKDGIEDVDTELREEAESVPVRRNETWSAAGAVFAGVSTMQTVQPTRLPLATTGVGARLGLRYFPMASSWCATALIEANASNAGLELGVPLRLELGYVPERIGLKMPSVRIGVVAHPFWTWPGSGPTTRSGVRAGALIGYSLPLALAGSPTLARSLSGAAGGLLLLLGLVPYAGPFLVLIGGAALLLLSTPEVTVGVEYGQDRFVGSYAATYFNVGIGM